MRYLIWTCLLIPLFLPQCKKNEIPIPACIQQKIDSIKSTPKSSPPAQVHSWLYRGVRMYLFSATEPDQLVVLVDENCNYICAPSGGITGGGDSTCTDFYQEAQHQSLLWQDDR